MKTATIKFIGTSPLLHSCDRLADPLDPATKAYKAISKKKTKTDQDHIDLARLQWSALMYYDDELGVIMPTQNIRATIVRGATLNKLGMQIKRGTMMFDDCVQIEYGKKLTKDQMWDNQAAFVDRRSVVVSKARIMCYRPKFMNWSLQFTLHYDETVLDEDQIIKSCENAGKFVGLGGFRPEKGGIFGRFDVELVK
jgi:hypothetical protein